MGRKEGEGETRGEGGGKRERTIGSEKRETRSEGGRGLKKKKQSFFRSPRVVGICASGLPPSCEPEHYA
eukprot:4548512-Pyramimonas_sp.AAC.1